MTPDTPSEISSTGRGDMSRRALLAGGGLLLAAATADRALAAEAEPNHDHNHPGMPMHQAVIDAAMRCVQTGQACTHHCIDFLRHGDNSLTECLWRVQQMVPMCSAMAQMVALNSPHIKAVVQTCIAVCEDCEKECRKHADKHLVCRACADACVECIKKAKALLT